MVKYKNHNRKDSIEYNQLIRSRVRLREVHAVAGKAVTFHYIIILHVY